MQAGDKAKKSGKQYCLPDKNTLNLNSHSVTTLEFPEERNICKRVKT
jgi:hypothetical protein